MNRRLSELELDLAPAGEGRVAVEAGGRRIAGDLIDPYRAYGFASFFFATYKLPLAFLLSTLVAVAGPWALAADPRLQVKRPDGLAEDLPGKAP